MRETATLLSGIADVIFNEMAMKTEVTWLESSKTKCDSG